MPKSSPKPKPRRLIKRATAMQELDTSKQTLRRLEARGLLTPIRLGAGRDVHYDVAELEALVAAGRDGDQ